MAWEVQQVYVSAGTDRSGMRYVTRDCRFDAGPWPLICCHGTGLKREWERHGRWGEPGEFADVYCPTPAQVESEEER